MAKPAIISPIPEKMNVSIKNAFGPAPYKVIISVKKYRIVKFKVCKFDEHWSIVMDNRGNPSSGLKGSNGPDLLIAGDNGDVLNGKMVMTA
jgi:hypothetical protein